MRDKKGKKTSFDDLISSSENANEQWLLKIDRGEANPNKIFKLKRNISRSYLFSSIAKYSRGDTLDTIVPNLITAIELCDESWVEDSWKLKTREGKVYSQYILSAYDEMLWMLSLGYLLDIPNSEFQRLVDVVDRDGVKDVLFEFIIKSKLPNRESFNEESYKDFFDVPKVFSKLRKATTQTDKNQSQNLVKEFIFNDWYLNHKESGWYNSHESPHNTYFGYWSYESAAIVVILGLDDKGFRDNEYYPKDLVDYYRSNHPH